VMVIDRSRAGRASPVPAEGNAFALPDVVPAPKEKPMEQPRDAEMQLAFRSVDFGPVFIRVQDRFPRRTAADKPESSLKRESCGSMRQCAIWVRREHAVLQMPRTLKSNGTRINICVVGD